MRTVTEADAKQAEDAAQALLAEEDSKPTTISKTGATAKTNKKKLVLEKRAQQPTSSVAGFCGRANFCRQVLTCFK